MKKSKKDKEKGVEGAPVEGEGEPKARGVVKGKRAEGAGESGKGRRTAPGHGVELETKWPK